jgi:DNA-binding NarL/FixJ family response regulator
MGATEIRPTSGDGATGDGHARRAELALDAAPDGLGPSIRSGVTALIIDDHQLFADVIRATLEGAGVTVLQVAVTAEEGLEAARLERPDLVLVDIGLPDESGLALGREILEALPEARVVALTALQDATAVAEALRLGFQGYVTKDTPVRQFLTTISAVLEGQVVVPKHLARRAAGGRSQQERHVALLASQLTNREREVLTMLAGGARTVEIAKHLSVSPNTVRTHAQSILIKLQVHSRLEAVAYSIRHGIVRAPAPSEQQ